MKEEIAKTKYCPQAIASGPVFACIGSKCMAWRSTRPNLTDKDKSPEGYCGLAGHPGAPGIE